jgi:hypothetical protein
MNKISFSFIIIIISVITLAGLMDYSDLYKDYQKEGLSLNSIGSYPVQILGSADYGIVLKSGPYGNLNRTKKIAFIVGVHPLEINSHKTIAKSILSLNKSANYSYYIYSVNVTKDRDLYNEGRMNGQLLANKFAVPDIIQNNYDLVVDVHSHSGGNYLEEFFIFAPREDVRSKSIATRLIAELPGIVYYLPPKEKGPTSPLYVTIPIINSGTPAIIYETYRYEPYETSLKHAADFIRAVEKIEVN